MTAFEGKSHKKHGHTNTITATAVMEAHGMPSASLLP